MTIFISSGRGGESLATPKIRLFIRSIIAQGYRRATNCESKEEGRKAGRKSAHLSSDRIARRIVFYIVLKYLGAQPFHKSDPPDRLPDTAI